MGVFDRLATWWQTKASATSAAVVGFWGSGRPVWTSANYEDLANQGYTKCSWAFRAIDKTAKAAGSVPWVLYRATADGEEIVADHPLLRLLNAPNEAQGLPRLVENLVAYRQIAGNAYLEGTGDNENRPPLELFALRPDRMSVVVGDAQHEVAGYQYDVAGRIVNLPAFQVLHWKTFHPTDDWYGLSPLLVAARAIDQFSAAQTSNVYLQQNMARPSGVLSTPNVLQDKAYERLKADIASNWTGSRNRAKPLLLEQGLTWTQIEMTPVELDFIESSKASAEQIVTALGVSWVLLNPTDATFANMATAKRLFYEDTVVPIVNDLAAELNRWLVPRFAGRNERLRLAPDWDAVDALQEQRDSAYTRNGKAYRSDWLVTLNEARAELGWDENDQHGDRYAWEIDYLLRWGQWPTTDGGVAVTPATAEQVKRQTKAWETNEAQRVEAFKAQERRRAPWYKAVRAQIAKRFTAERDAVASALDGVAVDKMAAAAELALRGQRGEWTKTLQAVYLAVGEAFAADQLRELKSATGPAETKAGPTEAELTAIQAAILAYLKANGPDRAAMIQSTTGKAIVAKIKALAEAGEDASAIVQAVEDTYTGWLGEVADGEVVEAARVDVITTTETVNAEGVGQAAGAEASGLPLMKEWISTRDSRVRPTHKSADGQVVKMSEPFKVSGSELMHPGDSSLGAAAEVVTGCRCFVRYDLDSDQV